MPILQKRKVHFAKDSKPYGMKKIKLDENLADNSSSDSESEDETVKNKISSKENNVSKVTEKLKTSGKKKAKVSQIQKYSTSSESENEIAKNRTGPKEKSILKVPKVPKTSKCSSSDSESEDETFKNKISSKKNKVSKVTKKLKTSGTKKAKVSESESENEIAKNETGPIGKNILKVPKVPTNSKCSSSESESEDEIPKTKTSPLKNGSPKKYSDFPTSQAKDTILSADEGLKNSKESSSKNLELNRSDSDEPPLVVDEDGDNDLLGLQIYMKDELKLNVSSPTKAKLNHDAPQSVPDKNSNNVNSSSESELDIEGTQETKNANNYWQIKTNTNQQLNNASSECGSDSEKIEKRDSEKDANFKENVNKNSNSVDSGSDSDIEGTQEILNKKSYKKVADSPKKCTNENVNTVISQSDSESDVEETQKPVKAKNYNKVMKTKSNACKMSNIIPESKSDSEKKEETKITKYFKKDFKTKKVIKHVSKVVTSKSGSDEEAEETQSKNKCIKGEETNTNLNEQSNLNTSETLFDEEETQKALKNECHSPMINYDLQMLSKRKKANDSENSDFELTLESGASHEEKEPASSDTDTKKLKASSDTIKKTSASRKTKLSLSKKALSPVDETMRDSDDLVPESKRALENGNLHQDKELASTDTDSKKEAVVQGKLKRTKKKTHTSPRKASLPVAEVKSENELALENGSLHEDKELASTDTEAVVNGKLKRTKKKTHTSPRKAPLPVAEVKSENALAPENGSLHEDVDQAGSDTDSIKEAVVKGKLKRTTKKIYNSPKKAPLPVAEVKSENELALENGSLHEDKELASTDTDSKKEAVVEGRLKTIKKKIRTSPRKAPLPVAEVKSKNELASENGSLHEDEDQTSSDTDAEKSKTNAKLKKANDLKKKELYSPEKAPAPAAPASPAVVKVRHKLNDLDPTSEEDEVSSDDSADDEEDLNESLLYSTEPTYQPTAEEKRILASIEIQIRHKVLPQHQVESTAGTRTLKQREKDEFEKYATLRRGTFDSTEDKQIKKNWKIFCKDHDWNPKNPKPFLSMKIKNKEVLMSQVNRKRFMQILAHGLPNRSLYSVFQRFKNLYDPHRTCRYTEDEDRVILDFISSYNPVDAKDRKFAELATILKRTRASVWRRYRVLKKKQLLKIDDGLCHSNR